MSLSTGVGFAVVPSDDRANVVCRDLQGCQGGYFEALFAFVVGLVSLSRKVCGLLDFRKIFLRYPSNGTSSENGSRNCFGQKI